MGETGRKALKTYRMAPTESIQAFRRRYLALLSPLHGAEEAHMLLRILLEHSTGLPAFELVRDPELRFSPEAYARAEAGAQRLLAHEPIQYITGTAHFYGREFFVNPAVLIPRRETEELIEWIVGEIKTSNLKPETSNLKPETPNLKLLDIGTGSGCIALTLALEMIDLTPDVSALDVSDAALSVAQKNAAALGAPVLFRQMDVLKARPNAFSGLDVIVSNPPYVTRSEWESLAPHVRDHEPGLALFVEDEDPLLFYREIARLGRHWLRPGGALFFEINEQFGQETVALLVDMGYSEVRLRQDLGGRDRMLRAYFLG